MNGRSRTDRSSGQYVVPIGGAPFVQPLRTMMDADPFSSSSSSSTMITTSDTHGSLSSPTTTASSASSSPTNTSADGVFTLGSPSLKWQAALQYSSALHEHTRRMWETERMNIERARLGLDVGVADGKSGRRSSEPQDRSGVSTSSRHGRRASATTAALQSSQSSSDGLQKRSTISGSVDALFRGRSRRQNKQATLF